MVNKIDQALQARGIKIVRDKRDLGYKGMIRAFMERIGQGNAVILVISDKYLRSKNCMFELVEIAENRQFLDRIFPIVLPDALIYDAGDRLEYVAYWQEQKNKLNKQIKKLEDLSNLQGINEELNDYDRFRSRISALTSTLKDMNSLTPSMHQDSDFTQLYDAIIQRMQSSAVVLGTGTTRPDPGEEDLSLTAQELEKGLTCFDEYLPERASVLRDNFVLLARNLRATLGPPLSALSPRLKKQRAESIEVLRSMCEEVLDISFYALCTGQTPPPYDSRLPFRGLLAFRPEHRDFYFGRKKLIEHLIQRLKAHPFLAIVGSSGSGKSSLVMAGLIPAIEAKMAYFTPSGAPLDNLHAAAEKADRKTVYVVDQFEELFTLTRDTDQREKFIKELLDLTRTNRVIVTMRADFWGEIAIYKDLLYRTITTDSRG